MHVDIGLNSKVNEAPHSLLCIYSYEFADDWPAVQCKPTSISFDVLFVKGELDVVLKVQRVVWCEEIPKLTNIIDG